MPDAALSDLTFRTTWKPAHMVYQYTSAGVLSTILNAGGDEWGLRIASPLSYITDPAGQITTLTHNVPRKITQVINPLGQRESFTYEGNRLKTYVSAVGIRTT